MKTRRYWVDDNCDRIMKNQIFIPNIFQSVYRHKINWGSNLKEECTNKDTVYFMGAGIVLTGAPTLNNLLQVIKDFLINLWIYYKNGLVHMKLIDTKYEKIDDQLEKDSLIIPPILDKSGVIYHPTIRGIWTGSTKT